MLALEECVEVHALRERGWSISAIARHLGRDRKTIRAYLSGERIPGRRVPSGSDPFDPFEAYVRQRLSDDPHVWASALFDEVVALGYEQSYPTLVRKIRHHLGILRVASWVAGCPCPYNALGGMSLADTDMIGLRLW